MAAVDFTLPEFARFLYRIRRTSRGARRPSAALIHGFYDSMLEANSPRRIDEVLQRANAEDLIDGHGIEGVHGEGARIGQGNMSYVNMGDTYSETLLYDVDTNTFLIGSWGGWLEAWERDNPVTGPCAHCTEEFPVSELDADTSLCPSCRDRVEEEQAAEDTDTGREFEVKIWSEDSGRGLLTTAAARWYDGTLVPVVHDDGSRGYGGVELLVNVRPRLSPAFDMYWRNDSTQTLYFVDQGHFSNRRQAVDLGWRLTDKSIEAALVELDRFLES